MRVLRSKNASRRSIRIAVVVTSMGLLASSVVEAVPVPGGTLDPLTIPKYVTPLMIPKEMPAKSVDPVTGKKTYDIEVVQFHSLMVVQSLHVFQFLILAQLQL